MYHVNSSVELGICYDVTNIEIYNEIMCIDDMDECYDTTIVYNTINILNQKQFTIWYIGYYMEIS